mmetsp:Transcript_19353/g.29671  ORF Transcript_19353/g.29671 Transcript_19353/m.29671 type:complete len:201 (-) Transcript_19353:431-1033(-)
MMQSAPSITALHTSEASARFGREAFTIESSTWVEMMTGLLCRLAFSAIHFWAIKTFSGGISIPSCWRATKMPSDTSRISSKFWRPSLFSILEMILMLLPLPPRMSLMVSRSVFFLTKEAATKSTPNLMPNSNRSSSSFSVREGISMMDPGKFTLFFSPRRMLFLQTTWTNSSWISVTSQVRAPSAITILEPTCTVFGRLL